jgi:hypothetical protein
MLKGVKLKFYGSSSLTSIKCFKPSIFTIVYSILFTLSIISSILFTFISDNSFLITLARILAHFISLTVGVAVAETPLSPSVYGVAESPFTAG